MSTTTLNKRLLAADILPEDSEQARLVGRVWSIEAGGPCPVFIRASKVYDASSLSCTVAELLERSDLQAQFDQAQALPELGVLQSFLDDSAGQLLAPIDLQAIKAAGVTFADSMLERVIEEQAKGDPAQAAAVRAKLNDEDIRPLGDRVTVQSSRIVPYKVRAVLHMKGHGPGRSEALAAARAACQVYVSRPRRQGVSVWRTALTAALHVEGVDHLELIEPAKDLLLDDTQAGTCTAIDITIADAG